MSSNESERRGQRERRQMVRGGRRPSDQPGLTPLILVVGNGGAPQREAETILGSLKFAVALASDVSDALRVLDGLHPDLIVARPADASRLSATGVRIVEYDGQGTAIDELSDRVLEAIRKNRR